MKTKTSLQWLSLLCALLLSGLPTTAQVLLSSGLVYTQDFNSLAAEGGGAPWANNVTLAGWYAARAPGIPGGVPYISYIVGSGTSGQGALYSFGTNGVSPATNRALGSIATPPLAWTNAWGVRFQNDTAHVFSNVLVSFTGEQWRYGGDYYPQILGFSYQISSSPITNATPDDDTGWIAVPALDFIATGVPSSPPPCALDGHDMMNQQRFSEVLLPGVVLQPGEELFLRWRDQLEPFANHALAVDDVRVAFPLVPTITNLQAVPGGTNPATGNPRAQFLATINPKGLPTQVRFEYGLTPPFPGILSQPSLPAGSADTHVSALSFGLMPGITYRWRVIAWNALGTTTSADQLFTAPFVYPAGDLNGDGLVSQAELDTVYANYLPTSPWLYMTNTAGLGGANVTFALTNSTAGAYSVLMSTNLNEWQYLGPATPRYEFTDTNAPAVPQRYYRLRWP